MELVNDNCVLFPRELEFHTVELAEIEETQIFNEIHEFTKNITEEAQSNVTVPDADETAKIKRETADNETIPNETPTVEGNVTVLSGK